MRVVFISVFLFLLFPVAVNAQDLIVAFRQEAMQYAPKNFFIASVADDRADKNDIGIETEGKHTFNITFGSPAADAVQAYITASVAENRRTQPVVLRITKLDARIKKIGSLWHINENMTLTFYIAGQRSIEYITSAHGSVGKDPAAYVEMVLRQSIEADFKKYDTWWQQNRKDIPGKGSVKVNVTVARTTDHLGFIVYSLQRPLQIDDFQGPVQGDKQELAETESGLLLSYTGDVVNGQLSIDIVITPYFDKNRSWFRESGKSPRVLAHEQAHFDITAIKACELADSLRQAHFTQDNYEQLIRSLQQQNGAASNAAEEQYDEETNHGTLPDKQEMWQNRISRQVRAVGCY